MLLLALKQASTEKVKRIHFKEIVTLEAQSLLFLTFSVTFYIIHSFSSSFGFILIFYGLVTEKQNNAHI